MTPFQWLTLGLLGLIVFWEVIWMVAGQVPRRLRLLRCTVWIAAAVAIARPGLLQVTANTFGIQRGADLVVYLLALTFFVTSFFFYSRYVRLERQIIELVREIAMLQAKRGGTGEGDDG